MPRRLPQQGVERLHNSDVWIIDATAFPNAGVPSVGVARQYCGPRRQVANGQVAVHWHGRRAEASGLLYGGLYRPNARIDESHRASHVKRPPGIPYRRKTVVAEELIDQGRSWEVPARPLVANAFYGKDFVVRHALRQRQLWYVVEIEPRTSVWTEDPHLPWPPPKKNGCPRQYPPLEALPRPRHLQMVAQEVLAAAWRHMTWRQGHRGAATLAVWRDPRLGGPWMARAATPAADGRVAAGGMAPGRPGTREVWVDCLCIAAP